MYMNASWKRVRNCNASGASRAAAIAVCCAALLGPFGIAEATPSAGFASTTIGPTDFGELDVKGHLEGRLKVTIRTQGRADVYVVTNSVVPGGYSGWHTHPGPSLVTVKSGTATYYDGDDATCTPHVLVQGEGFVDPGDGHVHMIRNEGADVLELVAFQIIPQGATRRIDVAAPGNCPF